MPVKSNKLELWRGLRGVGHGLARIDTDFFNKLLKRKKARRRRRLTRMFSDTVLYLNMFPFCVFESPGHAGSAVEGANAALLIQ